MSNRFFYVLISGFTLGIFLSSFFKMGFSFFLFLLILSILIFIFTCLRRQDKFFTKQKSWIILLSFFILAFGLGILRYEIKEIRINKSELQNQVNEKVVLQGIIITEPAVKELSAQLTMSVNSEKILISTNLFPEFHYGDEILVKGKLEKPENFSTEINKDFDYINYLGKDDIFYQINFAQVGIVSTGHGSFIKRNLFAFKNSFISKTNSLIKEPESALLGGLILGARNSLGKELQTDFRKAGVSHIVALSGYNITIIAIGIMFILSFLPRAYSMSLGVFGILAFAIMTGGSATVMRASIMAILVLLAKSTNRKYDINRALCLAGVFMLIQNPKILVFDISFQLSFLATIALIFVSPILEKKFNYFLEKYPTLKIMGNKFNSLMIATIATQIFVLPFILYKMGIFSVYALFANLLILPVIPAIMLFGFLAGLMAYISTILAIPLAFICSLLLSYVLKIIYIFSHLPFSSLGVNSFPLSFVFLIYAIFIIIFFHTRNSAQNKINEKFKV